MESVQVVTGASEALLVLMWLAAEPGANVIVPLPGFPTFSALPESLGSETRFYHIRKENDFHIAGVARILHTASRGKIRKRKAALQT